jgi:hypothetical protein
MQKLYSEDYRLQKADIDSFFTAPSSLSDLIPV